jgi:hypothetical protein
VSDALFGYPRLQGSAGRVSNASICRKLRVTTVEFFGGRPHAATKAAQSPDGCVRRDHGRAGPPEAAYRPSSCGRGQNVLVWIPWMCLIAGTVMAVMGAAIAARLRWTPLIGVPVGMTGGACARHPGPACRRMARLVYAFLGLQGESELR